MEVLVQVAQVGKYASSRFVIIFFIAPKTDAGGETAKLWF